MAEKQYAEGAKPRKAELTKSEKIDKEIGDVGKAGLIAVGAGIVGGVAASIAHTRETLRRDANIRSLQKRNRRIKIQRPDNL